MKDPEIHGFRISTNMLNRDIELLWSAYTRVLIDEEALNKGVESTLERFLCGVSTSILTTLQDKIAERLKERKERR